jgi:hypothetical protein
MRFFTVSINQSHGFPLSVMDIKWYSCHVRYIVKINGENKIKFCVLCTYIC